MGANASETVYPQLSRPAGTPSDSGTQHLLYDIGCVSTLGGRGEAATRRSSFSSFPVGAGQVSVEPWRRGPSMEGGRERWMGIQAPPGARQSQPFDDGELSS